MLPPKSQSYLKIKSGILFWQMAIKQWNHTGITLKNTQISELHTNEIQNITHR